MNKPNLFQFATSELSQDAFICWLLSWGKPEYAGMALHTCATELLSALLKKHGQLLPSEITSVYVKKQDKNIDVLCIVNDTYAIIIEDKTSTHHHSGQLEKYLVDIEGRKTQDGKTKLYNRENILPIYLKTRDQASYSEVKKMGYQPFIRSDFLEVLALGNAAVIESEIFMNFYHYLNEIEAKVQSYKTTLVAGWGYIHERWEGFFLQLQQELKQGLWGYVPNAQGGFMGFWWATTKTPDCDIYLQLENQKLCLKIAVNDRSQIKALRTKWFNSLKGKLALGDVSLQKPERLGHGICMTLLTVSDYRIVDENGLIDILKTTQQLKNLQVALTQQVATALKDSSTDK